MSHHEYEDDEKKKSVQVVTLHDLGVGIKHAIDDGPGKWDLVVAFADSTQGRVVEFSAVVFRGNDLLSLRLRVLLTGLEHESTADHRWNFVGKATMSCGAEQFRVRGTFSTQTREGHFTRITT